MRKKKKKVLRVRSNTTIKKEVAKKKPVRKPYRGIKHESDNELDTLYFLFELLDAGYIKSIERSPSFILTDGYTHNYTIPSKRKTSGIAKSQVILKPSLYTPEFKIIWNTYNYEPFVWISGTNSIFSRPFIGHRIKDKNGDDEIVTYIECKGSGKFDYKNMTRLFTNNQKVVWERYKLFVNLVKPKEFFKKWFCPANYLLTPTGRKKRLDFKPKTLKEYLITRNS